MSIRNLQSLLQPRRVALIGASPTPGSVGAVLAHNLLEFKGELDFVNPKHANIEGRPCWPLRQRCRKRQTSRSSARLQPRCPIWCRRSVNAAQVPPS